MAVTLAEVAAAAGLSGSTVSRALSDPDKVNRATRERVLAIAERMGYEGRGDSRTQRNAATGVIGLLVPDIANPFFPPIVKAVQSRANDLGRAVLIADTDERVRDEVTRARLMLSRVEGLVIASPRASDDALAEIAALAPIVFLNREIPNASSIIIDAGDGMAQAVEHLGALGHRHIAYLNGPRRSWSNAQRRNAVQAAAERIGLRLTEFGPFEPQIQSGAHAADLVHASGATGVIAYDDLIALGLIARLGERGISAGREISVIGVDDSPMSAVAYPTLTSVHVPGAEAGAASVDLLVSLIEGREATTTVRTTLETRLVVRSSTGLAVDRSS